MAARRKLYYGWYVVAIAALGGMLSSGSSQLMVGALLVAITRDTGWTHTQVSLGLLCGTLCSALVSPVAGYVSDRYGSRLLVTLGGAAMGAGFLVLGFGQGLTAFFVGYGVARGMAQGVIGGAVQRALAVRWFVRHRGRAMGVLGMSVPLGGAMMSLAAQVLLTHGHDWRDVFALAGILTLVLLVLPAYLVLRESPEAMGLAPDGDSVPGQAGGRAALPPEAVWSLRAALRTRALRLIILGSLLTIGANGTLVFYQVTFLIHQGLPAISAVSAGISLALAGALANVVWGFLAERVSERHLAVWSQLIAAILVPGFFLTDGSLGLALVYSALLGLVVRGEGAVVGLLLAAYFGRASFGRIAGVLGSFQIVALGAGPVLGAVLFEHTGSFGALFGSLGVIYVAGAVCYALARRPGPPPSVQGGPGTALQGDQLLPNGTSRGGVSHPGQ